MRLAAAICAVVIIAVLGVFGAVLAQKSAILGPAPAPIEVAAAAAPAAPPVVITDVTPAVSAPEPARAVADAAPSLAATPQSRRRPAAVAQAAAPAPAAPAPAAAPPAPPLSPMPFARGNPDALGVARVGRDRHHRRPWLWLRAFQEHDFLRPGEVVLTFDDGPWPRNTPAVLAALAAQCTKALFFPIGKHSMWHPEILKQVAAAGHTIGSHTWSHADLSKKSAQDGQGRNREGLQRRAVGRSARRRPRSSASPRCGIRRSWSPISASATSAIFSTDFDSFDFKMKKPEQVVQSVMDKLKKLGKGIVLMHDFQHATARRHRRAAQADEGRRLQGRADQGERAGQDDRRPTTSDPQGHEAADRQQPGRPRASSAPSASEPLRAIGRRIAERRCAGHHLRQEPPGHRARA